MLRGLRNLVVTMVVLLVGISFSYPQSEELPTVEELAENIRRHDAQIHRGQGTITFTLSDADKSHYDATRSPPFRYAFDGPRVRFSYSESEGASVHKTDYIADAEKAIRVDSQSSFVWIYDRH
jgi:hypothetical protein